MQEVIALKPVNNRVVILLGSTTLWPLSILEALREKYLTSIKTRVKLSKLSQYIRKLIKTTMHKQFWNAHSNNSLWMGRVYAALSN